MDPYCSLCGAESNPADHNCLSQLMNAYAADYNRQINDATTEGGLTHARSKMLELEAKIDKLLDQRAKALADAESAMQAVEVHKTKIADRQNHIRKTLIKKLENS